MSNNEKLSITAFGLLTLAAASEGGITAALVTAAFSILAYVACKYIASADL
jgi:hypothetical protein